MRLFLPNPSRLTILLFLTLVIMLAYQNADAQATLSVQGIVKKSNGVALDDGEYPITFKIYAVSAPTVVLWDETIDAEVISGIYSEVLGENPSDPLTIPFNQDYELGVSVGNQEMLPRIRLTSAPYALSLRGQTNQFPSTGLVLADNLRVTEGVLARAGTPGLSGVNKNGYGFIGNNDTGLFSTAYGKVSLFVNNVEKLEATSTGVTVQGNLGTNSINLYNDGGINYSTTNNGSFQGWRLADVDDFTSGTDGWNQYSPINSEFVGWNSATVASGLCHCGSETTSAFLGNFIMVSDRNNVLKKQFNIPGSFSQIKVKFRYVAIDGWDNDEDYGFGGFASDITNSNGSSFKLAWHQNLAHAAGKLGTAAFESAHHFRGDANLNDYWIDVEMSARANGNSFWVYIGAAMEQSSDELYGLGPVEVWVR